MTNKASACIDHGKFKSIDKEGYLKVRRKGILQYKHRLVYCTHNSTSIDNIVGAIIRHTCDNPRCINPQHLIIGTHQDNMADKVTHNRQSKGEAHGSAVLTAENVQYIRKYYVARCPTFGGAALGRKFGVDRSILSRIINNLKWQSI